MIATDTAADGRARDTLRGPRTPSRRWADHTTISPEVTLDETRRPPDTERES
jgi:hypothetical protein